MNAPEVVVTGMGCVSPHGKGVGALWAGLVEGRSAFKTLTLFNVSGFRNPMAGVVDGYTGDESCPRALRMLDDAVEEAIRDSLGVDSVAAAKKHIATDSSWAHSAIVTGTNFGGMSAAEKGLLSADPADASLDNYLFGSAGRRISERYGTDGPILNLSLSCASGTAAIGLAFDMIRRGRADVAIACGYDELSLYVYAGLSALRAITTETIRPFDKRRKGTLFSEGAAAIVLESAEHASARKARTYAKILGRAMNNDAYHMTAPEQEARGIQSLMRAALSDAQLQPSEIQHLNLHATGTPYNDAIESKAVHAVFGTFAAQIPVCSVKSSIGHCMGAAGTIESIAAIKTINEGAVPPVLGLSLEEKDPACDVNATLGAPLRGKFDKVLKTSYGFGGTNAAVVLARA